MLPGPTAPATLLVAGAQGAAAACGEKSEQEEKIAASVPVKRLGTAADIGRVVKFLCEPDSSFITGQTWYICGGASLGSLAL